MVLVSSIINSVCQLGSIQFQQVKDIIYPHDYLMEQGNPV
jgi:hypothetical protein